MHEARSRVKDGEFRLRNHYVSAGYLKRWETSGRIWTYRILVPNARTASWRASSLRSVAYHRHLYTRLVAGRESDEIERWLAEELEGPAQEPLEKATNDRRLTPNDWERILRFLAAQYVRTPAWYETQLELSREWVPAVLEKTLSEAVAKFEEAHRTGQSLPEVQRVEDVHFPLKMSKELKPGEAMGQLKASVLVGRSLWLWSMQHVLNDTWKILQQHKWTILRPPEGMLWCTSDNPVICLNFHGPDKYDFRGGWGRRGCEILMPLGPHHLLYTQIGKRPPRRGEVMPEGQAGLVRRLIAEHAFRMVFALNPDDAIPRLRPRVESLDHWQFDRDRWAEWPDQQASAELGLGGSEAQH